MIAFKCSTSTATFHCGMIQKQFVLLWRRCNFVHYYVCMHTSLQPLLGNAGVIVCWDAGAPRPPLGATFQLVQH